MNGKVNLRDALARIAEHWQPHLVGELNGQHVRLAKILGEFTWHSHDDEDELFLVVEGELTLRLRDREVHLSEGEFFIVPHGVEHMPVSEHGASILLFEPAATVNTGNTDDPRRVDELPRL